MEWLMWTISKTVSKNGKLASWFETGTRPDTVKISVMKTTFDPQHGDFTYLIEMMRVQVLFLEENGHDDHTPDIQSVLILTLFKVGKY